MVLWFRDNAGLPLYRLATYEITQNYNWNWKKRCFIHFSSKINYSYNVLWDFWWDNLSPIWQCTYQGVSLQITYTLSTESYIVENTVKYYAILVLLFVNFYQTFGGFLKASKILNWKITKFIVGIYLFLYFKMFKNIFDIISENYYHVILTPNPQYVMLQYMEHLLYRTTLKF